MSYFPVGHRFTAGEIDDFEDCDPTHYAGGYDIDLTYGRSLPPSYETCYPYRSSASDRPQFASQSKPSAYAFEALSSEYGSFSGPKARPGNPASAGGSVYSGPRPNFGFQPGGGVNEHGGRNNYARPEPGYGVKPPSSKFGSSHGGSSEYENPILMHDYGESGYVPGVGNPASGFGGSRRESGGSGYGGWPEKPTYPKPNYPQPSYARPSYPEPGYPTPSYPDPSYPIPSYPEPSYPIPSYPEPSYPIPSYPEPSYPIPSYPEPSYPTPGPYGRQKNEPDNSDHERRRHHQSRHHDRRH